ncbi:MAG: hypothetical protein QOF82_2307 [Frankiales bacterium]|jgi:hypothetical protein|nr:hypothetical protein [Frankiales bacterium]MDX6209157.1 hypothetical protein [Frankiales bacterium]MDX6213220.1 hypothetical protein [Frankiales bacterium]MDX6221597.1 hypothetical protein [Frankiales bacterium]
MRTIGIITTCVLAVLAAAGAVLAVRSAPDLQRYLKMRSM